MRLYCSEYLLAALSNVVTYCKLYPVYSKIPRIMSGKSFSTIVNSAKLCMLLHNVLTTIMQQALPLYVRGEVLCAYI
jgi:hypothetical protein